MSLGGKINQKAVSKLGPTEYTGVAVTTVPYVSFERNFLRMSSETPVIESAEICAFSESLYENSVTRVQIWPYSRPSASLLSNFL